MSMTKDIGKASHKKNVGSKLENNPQKEAKKANGRITFGHLSILNQYKKEVFKKLKVNATSIPDGAPIVFDSQNEAHQNIEVASACRGSAALPIVLSPVSICLNDGSEKLIVDGRARSSKTVKKH